MFLLSNIHDRSHRNIYRDIASAGKPIFDISEKQLRSVVNSDWEDLAPHELVCVISGSLKMSTIFVVEDIVRVDGDSEYGDTFVVTGSVVGKFSPERGYVETLNASDVSHERLRNNQLSRGLNIANLKTQLDSITVKTKTSEKTVRELKAAAKKLSNR